ncbi:MAG: hypothetical protein DRQ37_05755, partial [Gammaproteobacteria bacterium]
RRRGIEKEIKKGEIIMSVEHIQQSVGNVITYLTENPDAAVSAGPPTKAVMEGGLQCRATGADGQTIVTDMPEAVGGGGTAPSPGWLLMAALVTCDTTRIALRAAELGIALDTLEVSVESVYDDRGLFGMDPPVQAGPLSVLTQVTIGAAGVDENVLRGIVDHAVTCSPVADRLPREASTQVEVTIA